MTLETASSDELAMPTWLNGKAYARAHGDTKVEEEVKRCLLTTATDKLRVRTDVASEQVNSGYPILKKSIRISDLRDPRYWFVMMGICLLFLVAEVIVVIGANAANHNIVQLQYASLIYIATPVLVFFVAYTWAVLSDSSDDQIGLQPSFLKLNLVRTLIVFWLATGLLAINFWLVIQTGHRQSPFLPAFLTAALTVIGLPRENSRFVTSLSMVALAGGIWVSIAPSQFDEKDLSPILAAWGAGKDDLLPFLINAMTFGIGGLLTLVLRAFSIKIEKNDHRCYR